MFERGIHKEDVQKAILNGDIIERYPEDYPYPSCLIIGHNVDNQIIHVVCGIGEENLERIIDEVKNVSMEISIINYKDKVA